MQVNTMHTVTMLLEKPSEYTHDDIKYQPQLCFRLSHGNFHPSAPVYAAPPASKIIPAATVLLLLSSMTIKQPVARLRA